MLITIISICILLTVINAGRFLPLNANLADNKSDPIDSLYSIFQTNEENINIMIEPERTINPEPKRKRRRRRSPIASRKLTTEYALRIHKYPFTTYYTSEISQIYSTQKYSDTFGLSLPTIIKLSFSRINMWNPKQLRFAQIGIKNFHKFMDILHIKPMTINELNDEEFLEIDTILQLLIFSSRAIVHEYAFTDIWDRKGEYYWDQINEPSIDLYPWLNKEQIDKHCTLDVMKIIYWHSYDFLSKQIGSKLPSLDLIYGFEVGEKHKYIDYLINKYGFIPWKRDIVQKMSKLRDLEEFAECYSIGTATIFDAFFDDDEVKQFSRNFLAQFDINNDYDKTMQDVCDEVCSD